VCRDVEKARNADQSTLAIRLSEVQTICKTSGQFLVQAYLFRSQASSTFYLEYMDSSTEHVDLAVIGAGMQADWNILMAHVS